MATWQEAAEKREGDTIQNTTVGALGIAQWNGLIMFYQSWPDPGKAQIVTTTMSELVDVEKIDENLPESLKNDQWQ